MTDHREVAEKVNGLMVELCGEGFGSWTDDDGDARFGTFIDGVPVGLIVEQMGRDGALLTGYHVIGARVEDQAAAAQFVFRRNQQLRVGRVRLCGRDVVFFHTIFGPGVNKDSLRLLLGLLASESHSHPDLAAATGALRPSDLASLPEGDSEDS